MRCSSKLVIVIFACALVAQPIVGQLEDEAPRSPRLDSQGSAVGLLSLLLRPITATLDQAKRLLGLPDTSHARDFIQDGVDEIQMRAFRLFMRAYNKTYDSPAEVRRRLQIFLERRRMIQQSVRDFTEGRLPFIMRENAFTDWDESELRALARAAPPKSYQEMTEDEREAMMRAEHDEDGLKKDDSVVPNEESETISLDAPAPPPTGGDKPMVVTRPRLGHLMSDGDDDDDLDYGPSEPDPTYSEGYGDPYFDTDDGVNMTVWQNDRIPASKDWRDSGCVAKPIDQQKCGACYAIATMNTVETMRCLNKVSSPLLSSQQVIDCSTPRAGYQNHGCDGGWPTRVLKYLQDVRVVTRESCYPFVRRQQSCQLRRVQNTDGCTLPASPTGTALRYRVLENEQDILYHVAKTGPVITVMQALDSFLFYSRGIYDDPKCSRRRNDVDHAIAIVGYGRENGMNYWLIKNSWGTEDWGENGYGKYRRGVRACSIGSWGWVITS